MYLYVQIKWGFPKLHEQVVFAANPHLYKIKYIYIYIYNCIVNGVVFIAALYWVDS